MAERNGWNGRVIDVLTKLGTVLIWVVAGWGVRMETRVIKIESDRYTVQDARDDSIRHALRHDTLDDKIGKIQERLAGIDVADTTITKRLDRIQRLLEGIDKRGGK